MTHASLFSGIGGFDLAAEWAGWTNLFSCEIDPFCQKVLKHHFPNATQYSDIRATDFTVWNGRVDVLTGGFPCQPFSSAGKKLGTADERNLWPEMLRVVREVAPRWVVGENVRGIVTWSDGLVFEQVCADLEAEGYEVQPFLIPACGVGAPHRRDRIWFVAHRTDTGVKSVQGRKNGVFEFGITANTPIERWEPRPCETDKREVCTQIGRSVQCTAVRPCGGEVASNPGLAGLQGDFDSRGQTAQRGINDIRDNTTGLGVENPTTDTAGDRLQKRHKVRASSERSSIAGFDGFPTQPPVCSRNDGLSDRLDGITFPKWRSESIKAYGNAVVPQVVYQIFQTINQYEQL